MKKLRTLLIVFAIVALPGTSKAGLLERLLFPKETRLIVVFIDRSGSIPKEDWQIYEKTYRELVAILRPGDRFVLGEISAETLTSFAPVIDHEIPERGSGFAQEVLTERAREKLIKVFQAMDPDRGTRKAKAQKTKILDALNVAAMLFDADGNRKNQWLLILSDMLEDSGDARFDKQKLTPDVVNDIIEKRKAGGSLPNLQGVRIFVAGARARTSAKFFEVRSFWQRYFTEAGATMEPGRYVRDGLRFEDRLGTRGGTK